MNETKENKIKSPNQVVIAQKRRCLWIWWKAMHWCDVYTPNDALLALLLCLLATLRFRINWKIFFLIIRIFIQREPRSMCYDVLECMCCVRFLKSILMCGKNGNGSMKPPRVWQSMETRCTLFSVACRCFAWCFRVAGVVIVFVLEIFSRRSTRAASQLIIGWYSQHKYTNTNTHTHAHSYIYRICWMRWIDQSIDRVVFLLRFECAVCDFVCRQF